MLRRAAGVRSTPPELATAAAAAAALYAAAAEAAAADEVEPGARGRTGGFCGGRLADPAVAAMSGVWDEDEFGRESAGEDRRGAQTSSTSAGQREQSSAGEDGADRRGADTRPWIRSKKRTAVTTS